jgi:hypothetical protein
MTPIFTVAWPHAMPLAKNSAEAAQIHALRPGFCIRLFTVDSSWWLWVF